MIGYAASRCSTGGVVQLIAESGITFPSNVQYTTTEKTDASVIQGGGSIASLYSMLLDSVLHDALIDCLVPRYLLGPLRGMLNIAPIAYSALFRVLQSTYNTWTSWSGLAGG